MPSSVLKKANVPASEPHWVLDRYFASGRAVPRVGAKLAAISASVAEKMRLFGSTGKA
jgi:hypothetical protein